MEDWRGAIAVGEGPRWLILLTEVRQLRNGSWRYTYSVAPGRSVSYTVVPGPAMVSPYDPTLISDAARLAGRIPASAS